MTGHGSRTRGRVRGLPVFVEGTLGAAIPADRRHAQSEGSHLLEMAIQPFRGLIV